MPAPPPPAPLKFNAAPGATKAAQQQQPVSTAGPNNSTAPVASKPAAGKGSAVPPPPAPLKFGAAQPVAKAPSPQLQSSSNVPNNKEQGGGRNSGSPTTRPPPPKPLAFRNPQQAVVTSTSGVQQQQSNSSVPSWKPPQGQQQQTSPTGRANKPPPPAPLKYPGSTTGGGPKQPLTSSNNNTTPQHHGAASSTNQQREPSSQMEPSRGGGVISPKNINHRGGPSMADGDPRGLPSGVRSGDDDVSRTPPHAGGHQGAGTSSYSEQRYGGGSPHHDQHLPVHLVESYGRLQEQYDALQQQLANIMAMADLKLPASIAQFAPNDRATESYLDELERLKQEVAKPVKTTGDPEIDMFENRYREEKRKMYSCLSEAHKLYNEERKKTRELFVLTGKLYSRIKQLSAIHTHHLVQGAGVHHTLELVIDGLKKRTAPHGGSSPQAPLEKFHVIINSLMSENDRLSGRLEEFLAPNDVIRRPLSSDVNLWYDGWGNASSVDAGSSGNGGAKSGVPTKGLQAKKDAPMEPSQQQPSTANYITYIGVLEDRVAHLEQALKKEMLARQSLEIRCEAQRNVGISVLRQMAGDGGTATTPRQQQGSPSPGGGSIIIPPYTRVPQS